MHSMSRRDHQLHSHEAGIRGTKNPFHEPRANAATSEIRSAFHRQVPAASLPLALELDLRAATDPRA